MYCLFDNVTNTKKTTTLKMYSVSSLACLEKQVIKFSSKAMLTRIHAYCNTSASFQLDNILACSDVHPNLSPDYGRNTSVPKGHVGRQQPTWKKPCEVCSKLVCSNQKGILCDGCCKWHHIKCINIDQRLYTVLSSPDETWCCIKCSFPFSSNKA